VIDYSESEVSSNEQAFGFPILPKDTYLMRIAKVTPGRTADDAKFPGLIMPKVELRVEHGANTGVEQNGMPFFPTFVLGTERDPDFEDPQPPDLQNWQAKNRAQWKRIVVKSGAGVAGAASLEAVAARLEGCKLYVAVGVKHEKAKGKYEARDVNVINGVFSLAEGPGATNGASAAVTRAVPRQTFTVEEE
jgi:hypothetical protein